MKLYLSSYHFGNNPQQLTKLVEGEKKVAIIPNALDIYPDNERRQQSLNRQMDGLINLGLNPEVIDLREYFGNKKELQKKLKSLNGLWVLGGNTFVLRKAYKESGLDKWLLSQRENPNFTYAGYSAGVCVLTRDLRNIELMDNPNISPEGYKSEVIYNGLGLIDFAIVPHFKSNHPETEAANNQVEYLIKNNVEYKTLSDGEVLITNTHQ